MSDRASALVRVDLEPGHLARTVLGALALALYAAWMAADILPRWLSIPFVAVIGGYLLVDRDPHGQVVYLGYAFGALLVLTPILMILPDVRGDFGEAAATMAFMTANLLLLVLFLIPAVLVVYATYRFDGGRGVIRRLRDR